MATKMKPRRSGATPFQRWLRDNCACAPARRWVGRKTLRQAWAACDDVGWMNWLLAHLPFDGIHCGCMYCRFGAVGTDVTLDDVREYAKKYSVLIALPRGEKVK